MKKITAFYIVIICLFIASLFCSVYFYLEYRDVKKEYDNFSKIKEFNKKVIFFNKIFVEKVLIKSDQVSYEDRIKLENAVIATEDEELISQWHSFLNSKTEAEAQEQTKQLLLLFVTKITY